MITPNIVNTTSQAIDEHLIATALGRATAALELDSPRFISIEFVTPVESRELNKRLRNKDYPTDIISISTQESTAGEQLITETADGGIELTLETANSASNDWPVIGQLIICLEAVRQNAESAGQPFDRELEWVIEHGVYHVMGFHHDQDH